MSTTKLVYWGGSKGGVGKSTSAHLSCLGAILSNEPAAYVLTDPDREIRHKGRPYEVLDGREPKQLASILAGVYKLRERPMLLASERAIHSAPHPLEE